MRVLLLGGTAEARALADNRCTRMSTSSARWPGGCPTPPYLSGRCASADSAASTG